jgi:hypothetical protein
MNMGFERSRGDIRPISPDVRKQRRLGNDGAVGLRETRQDRGFLFGEPGRQAGEDWRMTRRRKLREKIRETERTGEG